MTRAARLIHTLFFMYRTRCYHNIFSHVEQHHGLLYVYHHSRLAAAMHQEFPVRSFPFDLIPSLPDLNACLAAQQCLDFCSLMYDIVNFFLSGAYTLQQIRSATQSPIRLFPNDHSFDFGSADP